MLKDFLIAISLANLWFVDIWKLFLIRSPTAFHYHWKVNPGPILLAAMLDVLLLSAILWLSVIFVRRLQKPSVLALARWIFATVFVLLVLNLLLIMLRSAPLGPLLYKLRHNPKLLFFWQGTTTIYQWLAMLGLLAAWIGISLMILGLIYRRHRVFKVARTLVLIISPFAFVTFAQATAQCLKYYSGSQFRETTSPALSQNKSRSQRILWLVFDELDFRLSFIERPITLKLSEFDQLRNESLFATNAYPPAGDTLLSFPALITGRLVSRTQRIAPNELILTFGDNNESRAWSTAPNVFSKAQAEGFETGLAGWYHPYCRIIGNSLTQCSWEDTSFLFLGTFEISEFIPYSENPKLTRNMLRLAKTIFLPGTWRVFNSEDGAVTWRKYLINEFSNIHQRALAMATDRNLQFVFIHYSIPHPLGIYDRHRDEFSLDASSGYFDNLLLADRALAQLRQAMVDAGVWKNTTILISSDHSLRADRVWKNHSLWTPAFSKEDPQVVNKQRDERIPFILKLSGESEGMTYEPAFNTVLSQDLLLAILSGEVSKKEDIVSWLDQHRSIAESPYVQDDQ